MKHLLHANSPYRAFTRVNIALSLCALSLTSLLFATKAKESLAAPATKNGCKIYLGNPNCPTGYKNEGISLSGGWRCYNSMNDSCCKYVTYRMICSKKVAGKTTRSTHFYKELMKSFRNSYCTSNTGCKIM